MGKKKEEANIVEKSQPMVNEIGAIELQSTSGHVDSLLKNESTRDIVPDKEFSRIINIGDVEIDLNAPDAEERVKKAREELDKKKKEIIENLTAKAMVSYDDVDLCRMHPNIKLLKTDELYKKLQATLLYFSEQVSLDELPVKIVYQDIENYFHELKLKRITDEQEMVILRMLNQGNTKKEIRKFLEIDKKQLKEKLKDIATKLSFNSVDEFLESLK